MDTLSIIIQDQVYTLEIHYMPIPLKNCTVCSIRTVVSQCVSIIVYLCMFHSWQSSEIGGDPSSGLILPPKQHGYKNLHRRFNASVSFALHQYCADIPSIILASDLISGHFTLQQKQQHQECDLGKSKVRRCRDVNRFVQYFPIEMM